MYGKFKINLERDYRMNLIGGVGYIEKDLPIYVIKKDDVDNYFMAHLIFIRHDNRCWSFYGAESVETGEFIPANKLFNFVFLKVCFHFDCMELYYYDDEYHKPASYSSYPLILKPSCEFNGWIKDGEKGNYTMEIAFAESFEEFDIPQSRLKRNIEQGVCCRITP